MKLVHKLFATSMLTSIIIVLVLVVIMPYLASRDFANYLTKVQMERLEDLIGLLKVEYVSHHGWDQLKHDPRLWERIVAMSQKKADFFPPFSPPHDNNMHGDERGFDKMGPAPLQLPAIPYPQILHRLTLFDEQKQIVAGMPFPSNGLELVEIISDSKTIGWLGFRRPNLSEDPLRIHFVSQQIKRLIFVGFGILILAALAAFLLSRHLLQPIQQLSHGAHALASRRFETRIDARSSDELGELADDFNKMANTLERYEYMRRQWISDISHELRTPLAVLRGEVEAVLDGVRDMRKETLESIHTEVLLLTKIVNDLHSLTIIESETMTMEKKPVDILRIAVDVLGAFQNRFSENEIEIIDELPHNSHLNVMGDAERLAQVFTNIFENTLRYTDPPGKMRIQHVVNKDFLSIIIEDSAPGVADSALPFIFERLYRVDSSRTRTKGGSGLGLAICQAIIENSGGRITATNSSLGGLQIKIMFPIARI